MPAPPLRLRASAAALGPGFARIRAELHVPGAFSAAAVAEADSARVTTPHGVDRRDIPLITIDPAGSRDLDQAVAIAPRGTGYRVHYAIADVAALVAPGGAVDEAARERGVTVYMPDTRVPLHPPGLGEGHASLLPDADRPAVLWTIDLDADGEPVATTAERATVRSRRALSYAKAQEAIDAGTADETLRLLREVGRRRIALEIARGGVSLTVPVQDVRGDAGGYTLEYETPLPVEGWNAQISLLTGVCAARIMTEGGIGLFRALEPAEPRDLESLRASALALGVRWPAGARYPDVIRSLRPENPCDAAFAVRATRLFRGASYVAWRREDGGAPPSHAAIAATYAHVTAPLRRLADRFANEIVVSLCAGGATPQWALEGLDQMPAIMSAAGTRERHAERAAVDLVESAVLAGHVGETFPATVLDVRDGRATVQLTDPAVVAPLEDPAAAAGDRITVRLASADTVTRRVVFARA